MRKRVATTNAPQTCPHCGGQLCVVCRKPMEHSHNPIVHDHCAEICMGCCERVVPGTLDAEGYCDDCVAKRAVKVALAQEHVRRLAAWAVRMGGRRPIAESLALEAAQHLSPAEQRRCVTRAMAWEMTGAAVDLRWVVKRLMPGWQRVGTTVVDPAMASVESHLTRAAT